jgi:tRNA-dihydrouridine synthase B
VGAALAGAPVPETPRGPDLAAIVAEHYEGVLSEYGVAVGVRAARKHLNWYLEASGRVVDPALRLRMIESQTPAEVLDAIEEIFGAGLREAA